MKATRINLQNVCPVVFAAISTAFWDQLIPSEVDSNNLFAVTTPHVDRHLQPSTPSFHSFARDTSQGVYLTYDIACGHSREPYIFFSRLSSFVI